MSRSLQRRREYFSNFKSGSSSSITAPLTAQRERFALGPTIHLNSTSSKLRENHQEEQKEFIQKIFLLCLEMERLKNINLALGKQNEANQIELIKLRNHNRNLQNQREQIDKIRAELTVSNHIQQNNDEKKAQSKLIRQISYLEQKLAQKENELETLKSRHQQLNNYYTQLKSRLHAFESVHSSMSDYNGDKLREKMNNREDKIQELRMQNNLLKKLLEEYKESSERKDKRMNSSMKMLASRLEEKNRELKIKSGQQSKLRWSKSLSSEHYSRRSLRRSNIELTGIVNQMEQLKTSNERSNKIIGNNINSKLVRDSYYAS